MDRREAKLAAALIAGGSLPLAIGAALPLQGDGPALWCPFKAATGVPCPLCGGTRAVVHLAHGDPGFLGYNAPWALLAVLAVLAGVAGLLAATRGSRVLTPLAVRLGAATATPRGMLRAIALAAIVPWAWALAAGV